MTRISNYGFPLESMVFSTYYFNYAFVLECCVEYHSCLQFLLFLEIFFVLVSGETYDCLIINRLGFHLAFLAAICPFDLLGTKSLYHVLVYSAIKPLFSSCFSAAYQYMNA